MSREGRLAKNTLILSIGTFLPRLASFITLPILTGYLTKAEMGTYDLITILESLFLPTATLQIQAAAFRFLIDARSDVKKVREIITNIAVFIIPVSFFSLSILYFCLYMAAGPVRILICLYFLFDILSSAERQVCRGLTRNLYYSISAIISSLGKMIFIVICVYWLRTGLLGTVIALFAASLFSFLYLFFFGGIYRYIDPASFNRDLLKEMLKYSWPMVPNSMSAWVMRVSDRLVVTAFMGVAANAVYAVANKIPSLLNIAQSTFTMAWQENASVVSKDRDASEYYSSMFRVMFDLMAGFFGLLIAATPILFKLLIRGDYSQAYYQIPILFVAMFFFGMSTFLGGIYVAYKQSKSVGITTMAAAACNLVVDLALIRFIGLYAASGSTLVSYLFLFIYRCIDVQHIVRVRYSVCHMVMMLAIMVTESVLCFKQQTLLNVINLIIGVVVFAVFNKTFALAVFRKGKSLMKKFTKKNRTRPAAEAPGSKSAEMSKNTTAESDASTAADENGVPALAKDRSSCCGCSACYAVCPSGAITMEPDEEGFLYPVIDAEKCVHCRRCVKVCAFKRDKAARSGLQSSQETVAESGQEADGDKLSETLAYACRAKDREVLEYSSSGGLFTVISDLFLGRGDAVLCSAYDYEEHRARFRLIHSVKERDESRGSMYMQSYALDSWKEALAWLKENPDRKLLYTGLGCQAAAFKEFARLNGIDKKVTTVDIICHGAPSPLIWKDYAQYLEKQGRLSGLNFRDKKTGWSRSRGIVLADGKEVSIRQYRKIYSDRYTIRMACSSCPYTRVDRETDMTIGDFWNMEKSMPDFVDEMGTSLALVHTEKGRELFESIKDDLEVRQSNTKDCLQMNLQRPTEHSARREQFWADYRSSGIEYVMKKYGEVTLAGKVRRRLKKIFG